MAKFDVFVNKLARKVHVDVKGAEAPDNGVLLGEFDSTEPDASGAKFNQVLANEVRGMLGNAGIENFGEFAVSVSPEAYAEQNGDFYPQVPYAEGTRPTPMHTSDENPENSTQRDSVVLASRERVAGDSDETTQPDTETETP